MTQYAFFFDQSRCSDCRTCSISCRDWNDVLPGDPSLCRKFSWEQGVFPELDMPSLFAPCYHCENPACVTECTNQALSKDPSTGAVLVDKGLCKSCGNCWDACPYGVPFVEPGKAMSKCDMCIDRISNGDLPVCVSGCPMRALDFGPIDEIIARYGDVREIDEMPSTDIVKPAIIFKKRMPKKQLVSYDPLEARKLLGFDSTVPSDGVVLKNRIDFKNPDREITRQLLRSEEW